MPTMTTNHDTKKLCAMAADGMKLLDAADAMYWDFRRVLYWEKRLGIKFQRAHSTRAALPEKELNKLRHCAASGMTLQETAYYMMWGRDKVYYWEQKLELRFHRLRHMKPRSANGPHM